MLLAIIQKRGNMLVFDLFVHFMCLMELPIPTSLIDLPLDRISHGNVGLFYYRTALSMEICHSTMGIFRQTDLSQEAIRLTAGDGGPSTGCQTHSNA